MPDFLLIGAGKCGTTSLHHYLQQHPQVFMSEIKEPNFFALEQVEDVSLEDDKEQFFHYPWAVKDLESYKSLFHSASDDQMKGEASTMYLYMPDAPNRIKHYVPDVKLVAIFRHPADRLYSRYLHLAREDRLPTKDFSDALDKNSIWWKRNDLVKEGFYYQHLSRYFELFPAENIKVYLYEDLNEKPKEILQDLYRFLEIDEGFQPDLSLRLNQSGFVKNKVFNKLFGQQSVIKRILEKRLSTVYQKAKNSTLLQKKLSDLRAKNLHRPAIDPILAQRITLEIYQEDIIGLQSLIGKDLTHWLKKYQC